eukprot:scaffold4300_cov81-Isochrysis_galbana.AAC.3
MRSNASRRQRRGPAGAGGGAGTYCQRVAGSAAECGVGPGAPSRLILTPVYFWISRRRVFYVPCASH